MPWFDYSGRFSPLKFTVFVALFFPAVWTAYLFWHGDFGAARPVNEAIHEIGRWTIRLIFLALAVSSLRWVLDWQRLLLVRRMVGVAAFAYVMIHLSLYVVQEAFNFTKVATEIVFRIYLEIGFTALLILAVLTITSTDGMMRRLRKNWTRLHRLVYLAALLAVIHQFMQSKADVDEPWVMTGLLIWLMGYRLLDRTFATKHQLKLWYVGALSIAAGVLTALGESVYYWIKLGVSPMRVLSAYTALTALRPGWVVLFVGLGVTAAGVVAAAIKRGPPQRTAAATAKS
jgi:sulfoxide reductase heme-binding subunit YedZ